MTKMPKVLKTHDQGIGLNGTVKNEIVAVFIVGASSGAAALWRQEIDQ